MFMDQSSIFEMQAELCRAMSNAIRLEIVHLLREGPKHVSELAKAADRPPAMISRHLATLRNAGVIISQRQGSVGLARKPIWERAEFHPGLPGTHGNDPFRYAVFYLSDIPGTVRDRRHLRLMP